MHIKIGTRGSKLALWQAHYVEELLNEGGVETEVVIIETKGDKILNRALSKIGSKGVFTQELEDQLLDGSIDIAVHSAKDLQSQLDDAFELIAYTEREKANDVLVSHNNELSLKSGETFIVGTSSTRRIAVLRHFYPHIQTVDMRGNLQTRLGKLNEGHCDALLLAYAGVHRMKYDDKIAEHLLLDEFTPAVGQGSVAIECAVNLCGEKKAMVKSLTNHPETETCLLAERAFLKRLQGGCSIPVFGMATLKDDQINITGGIISLDGKELIRRTETGSISFPEELGTALANELLEAGADRILREIREQIPVK
ncbi:hydroxymethylbilane synthase [Dyadobacter chenwenxiniae]|uniref:Porphobilinogen deaminase n=1 Tax=Dyadobacter chenwenxiniae TaxID=2906456 RepID=A0A9X1PNU8_9BACT|nr:hydroxymethylbilane synthase [Dyadobacter chenwenxiniae]MCF0064201.1 hydroxymethylbilane synthase [Dyadobacter chenwenxiniae]UON82582.1 hydroxymethylbilane synthase [Dyadobacter chenwenxiniae]